MKETETFRNSRHTDPDHRVAADRVGAERSGGLHSSTSGIAQAPMWKYVFLDVCKKKLKRIIFSAASASEDIFVYLVLYK